MRSLHIDTARTWRGGQNQVLLTVTGLNAAGHEARLAAHENGELRRRVPDDWCPPGFAPRGELDIGAAWQLASILGDTQPDVVHAHDPMAVSLVAVALRLRPPVVPPLVVAARRVDFHLKRHAFSRWKYRHVDVFVAASAAIAAILERDGIEPERLAVVRDAVDVGRIDRAPVVDARAAFGLPRGAPVVGNVAALAAHKGQRDLVDAAAIVTRTMPDARFLIVGTGELHDALARQIRHLGLDRHVHLAGFRQDAPGLIKSFDLFVLPSVTEGLGSVVLEAMACGRAVVATRAGGIPEAVVDGVTGRLTPPQDPPALARAIADLLADPDRRAAFGRAGRARVDETFGVERLVRETTEVYTRHRGRPAPAS